MALLTGMRRGEFLCLTWDDVNLGKRSIRPRQTKNGEARIIPIGDDLLALLRGLPRHVATNRVFTYHGRPLASLQGSCDEARRLAGLSTNHFHDLRHTWASRQVVAGTNPYALMKLGGWKTVAMVQRYAHLAPDYMLEGIKGTTGRVVREPLGLGAEAGARR